MPVETFSSSSPEETISIGERIARRLPPRAVVLLIGDLGAGKTTLAKGIVQGLGLAPAHDVASPTYTLIHEFGDPPHLYHIDLYRLDHPEEVLALGWDELLDRDAVFLIEWGERFPQLLPASRFEIRLRALASADARLIELRTPA